MLLWEGFSVRPQNIVFEVTRPNSISLTLQPEHTITQASIYLYAIFHWFNYVSNQIYSAEPSKYSLSKSDSKGHFSGLCSMVGLILVWDEFWCETAYCTSSGVALLVILMWSYSGVPPW